MLRASSDFYWLQANGLGFFVSIILGILFFMVATVVVTPFGPSLSKWWTSVGVKEKSPDDDSSR